MSILTHATQPVNVMPIGDTYLVIDRNSGFVTLLRQGSESNVVGAVAISELRKALGHPLGFAMPHEQTQSRQDAIVAMVKNATSKSEYDAAMAVAYGYDAVLTGMLQAEYGYRWN